MGAFGSPDPPHKKDWEKEMEDLNVADIKNILVLLQRVQFNGLEEAKVGAVISAKLERLVAQAEKAESGDDV